jgi:hypothetical protein
MNVTSLSGWGCGIIPFLNETGTNLGRAGSPLPAARPHNVCGAHGVTRPTHCTDFHWELESVLNSKSPALHSGPPNQARSEDRPAIAAGDNDDVEMDGGPVKDRGMDTRA